MLFGFPRYDTWAEHDNIAKVGVRVDFVVGIVRVSIDSDRR